MEGIVNIQKSLQKSIEKGLVNFKKSPKDRLTLEYVEARLENLEKDWLMFRENNSKLYGSYNLEEIDKSIYVTMDIYENVEDTYFNYKSQIMVIVNDYKSIKDSVKHTTKPSDDSSSSVVKLPKISIPIFSGKYSEWTTFRDLFISLVHKNSSLDKVQKLHYLKGHLTGEAEQLIRHTPITSANYDQCWDQLEQRYNNKRYLANCILKRLFGQRRMNLESASGLKELLDSTCDCLNALKNLNVNVSTWDIIIIHIVTDKLDSETRKQWELSISSDDSNELPTLKQFKLFIENRFRALECLDNKKPAYSSNNYPNTRTLLASNSFVMRCEYCSDNHKLCFCKDFIKQTCEDRREFVKNNNMCFNCLGGNHTVYNCKKLTTCRFCKKRHHSLLHLNLDSEKTNEEVTAMPSVESTSSQDNPDSIQHISSHISTGKVARSRQVLLATALIKAESISGKFQTIRALVDQGSQACFITEATVQYLRLKKVPAHGVISGLGQSKSTVAKYMVSLVIQSRIDPEFKLKLNAYVLNNITSYLPERSLNTVDWVDLECLPLADPEYHVPNKINVLLGADVYTYILKEGIKRNPSGSLLAQSTTLGWILSGVVNSNTIPKDTICERVSVMHAQINEDEVLKRFWEIEEASFNSKKLLTAEEELCEKIFKRTTKRTSDGRYIVKLPFRDEDPQCRSGGSRKIAEARFKGLERKFVRDPELKENYSNVIKEYLQLGHMRPVKNIELTKEDAVYLPHHAVIRNDKTTSKVRVVFNASEKNEKGISLNDTLMVGPTLQADLRHTVLKWRTHYIGLIADIVKMYRQVKISEEHAKFQRIVWRESPEMEISSFELVTVTFGTASAPFLAVRTLHQVAYDEGDRYPQAKDKVLNCFYMDDLMTGCSSLNEGVELFNQLNGLLKKGGFELQKWNSNNKELLKKLSILGREKERESNQEKATKENNNSTETEQEYIERKREEKEVEIKMDNTVKILGLTWNRNEDCFQYSVNLPQTTAPVTKRSIISTIARLFDPLGWIAPSIILAKIFIQKLWLTGLTWDEDLPTELVKEWNIYFSELPLLTKARVPRWLNIKSNDVVVELHGFCDASKFAYSAVTYIRVVDVSNDVSVTLVAAKTRVAPIKQISIPRLELCGAVLLSKLLIEVAEVLNISKDHIRAWTDSTVVLAWLNSHPSRWKTFVGNRVSEILCSLNSSQWFHISTKINPADCASRGILPSLLADNSLWFSGPPFLKEKDIVYSKPKVSNINLEESVSINFAAVPEMSLIERFSSLQRLLKIIGYCRRFLKKEADRTKSLKKIEIDEALECCIRKTQKEEFSTEYTQLEENRVLKGPYSKLKSLCPYLDKKGIIRVSGRLQMAQLDEQMKHPIVLPGKTHLTQLIIKEAHEKTLHGGIQLMLNYLRTAYWIIGVRNLVKGYVRRCLTCVKQRANIKPQIMGSLPTVRCSPARPFLHSGVDYAGPINIRTTKGRGHQSHKGYICLFVCMATRAIHLEVVSDMSTQGFLAAFRRFVSRRGHCAHIWSDNGTTFVGACKELQQLKPLQKSLAEYLESHNTEWHFIPPHAPNFGGLWEAGVKSTKFHLKRVIGESTLTYEEMSTLLSQIEACLNSRPISVVNITDPGEPQPLTPGHFLVGGPLINIPENSYEDCNVSSLSRWQFVQRMLQTFWRRWSQEYLTMLLNRYKWTTQTPEPNIGDIVLIKEDNLPPSRWLLGRIEQKHPGHDNITRVVTIRTKSSLIKRPTSKICILPVAT